MLASSRHQAAQSSLRSTAASRAFTSKSAYPRAAVGLSLSPGWNGRNQSLHGNVQIFSSPLLTNIFQHSLRYASSSSNPSSAPTSSTATTSNPVKPTDTTHEIAKKGVEPLELAPATNSASKNKGSLPARIISGFVKAPGVIIHYVSNPRKVWATIKHEFNHYRDGSKLLWTEIKISWKLYKKLIRGETLTRREERQRIRTTQDILRIFPLIFFVAVPFMEFLLPVALKVFPNMLPSTFESSFSAEEKQRKLLRARIAMAKYLQDSIGENSLKADNVVQSEEFKTFFRKVRSTGESPSHDDIVRVAKLFETDATLDNLSRPQVVSMCKYMNINAFGTDNFLRNQIRSKLSKIRKDDAVIYDEGIDSLTTSELQSACQSRGIRTSAASPSQLRKELQAWIDLHYTNKVSGVLLILSKAFHFNEEGADVITSLKYTLSSLPDNLLSEAELEVLGHTASTQEKLEVLDQQQDLIEDEAEQEQEEQEARQARKDAQKKMKEEEKKRNEEAERIRLEEETRARGRLPESEFAVQEQKEAEAEEEAKMTKEQLGELAEALGILSAKSSMFKERNELKELMEENLQAEEDQSAPAPEDQTPEEKAVAAAHAKHLKSAIRLNKRIRSMIKQIDAQLDALDAKIGQSMKLINVDENGKISLVDLKKAMNVISHPPEQAKVDKILEKLDPDHDGFVVLDHVVELTQDEGLGVVMDDVAKEILSKGAQIKEDKEAKPKKEDVLSD